MPIHDALLLLEEPRERLNKKKAAASIFYSSLVYPSFHPFYVCRPCVRTYSPRGPQ